MTFSWNTLKKPILGLAPMDGVTDSVFRTIVFRHSPPDIMFTEFVSVEGLARRIPSCLNDLKFLPDERPMIAQIYGYELESFREAVKIVAALDFDGVDINMGCPAKSVVHSGGGAALIKACPHAKEILKACGESLNQIYEATGKRLPLSVKTRLGYDKPIIKDWVGQLLDRPEISNISLHGRTLKQGYSGEADWEAIAQAAELAKGSGKTILGNGDIQTLDQAFKRIRESSVDGVLVGRATYGNPWWFKKKEGEISLELRAQTLLEHARLLWERRSEKDFIQIRKHAGWYMKGFHGAADMRNKLVRVNRLEELEEILKKILPNTNIL